MDGARVMRQRLGLRFAWSALLLALVAVVSFSALDRAQSQLSLGGHRVDIAGRQRMLTQQIALQSLLAVQSTTPAARTVAVDNAAAALTRMRTEHDALLQGASRLGLAPASMPARGWYAGPGGGLDGRLARYWSDAEQVTQRGPEAAAAAVRLQQAAAPRGPLMQSLERVVAAYDAEVVRRSDRLHLLIVLAGVALLSCGIGLLLPLGLALRRERRQLVDTHRRLEELKRFDEAVLESVGTGVLACDAQGRVVLRNGAQRRLVGVADIAGGSTLAAEEVAARLTMVRQDGSVAPRSWAPLREALDSKTLDAVPLTLQPDGGEARDVLLTTSRICTADGTLLGAVASLTDITAERQALAQLRESATFNDAVLAASPDLIAVMDLATTSNVWSSGTLADLLGYSPADLAAMGSDVYTLLVHPDDLGETAAANAAVAKISDGQVLSSRYRVKHADGAYRTLARRVTPFRRTADGTVVELLTIARDISESVEMEDRLREAALHDALTGLPNRRLLADRLQTALRRNTRNGAEVAVLFCDLDGFKHVNDTAGHAAGDAVLVATAERLRAALRQEDTVARVGGDEFVVLLDASPTDEDPLSPAEARARARTQALAVVSRLTASLRRPIDVHGVAQTVTTSIGVTFAASGADPEEVLREADRAMYLAKSRGKNRHEVFGGPSLTDPPAAWSARSA